MSECVAGSDEEDTDGYFDPDHVAHHSEQIMTSGISQIKSTTQAVSPVTRPIGKIIALLGVAFALTWLAGCSHRRKNPVQFAGDCGPCQSMLQQIQYPDLLDESDASGDELFTGPPMTISNFQEMQAWELSLEECVELALTNSKVMQKLGGVVVTAPGGATTLYDQAINETRQGSVESALSAFDAQLNTSVFFNRSERIFNNRFFGGGNANSVSNSANYRFELSKQTASGAVFAIRNTTDYNRASPVTAANLFGSAYDTVNQIEVRQPILRGRGTLINRIAGPNATPGNYNGVLIARIRSDISLADFESSVRNLVRDVEDVYWELYFFYRDLDTKLVARESSRETWENRKLRLVNGVGRPDDEALARQQYFSFQLQTQNALSGVRNGQLGVLGAERNLRRLLGLVASDGRIIRPSSDPTTAPVAFDWDQSQSRSLNRRVELRRQKWTIRQREFELIASKSLNQWRFDFIGQYGFRGFGDNWFGSRSRPNGSAVDDLFSGDLDDWQVGVELGGAIGNRQGHLAIRNAELQLVRERAILKEQQRQILHDLNAAFTEVDRSMESMKTSFNLRIAAQDELDPKRERVDEGQDPLFFLLDAKQRAANAESAVHRSIVDYNKSLMTYAYVTGTLLSRYNIHLSEGEWTADAQNNAVQKSSRFVRRDASHRSLDTWPVTRGQYDQNAFPLESVAPVESGDSLPGATILEPSIE